MMNLATNTFFKKQEWHIPMMQPIDNSSLKEHWGIRKMKIVMSIKPLVVTAYHFQLFIKIKQRRYVEIAASF